MRTNTGKYSESAFTLIELLMVMGVLAALATIFLNTFPASQRRARDAQRRSDLNQYQISLERFANARDGFYPRRTVGQFHASDLSGAANSLCNDLGLSNCPEDPRDGQTSCDGDLCRYYYQSGPDTASCDTGGEICAIRYTLRAQLEAETNSIWAYCSDGRSGTVEDSATFSDGACPSGL
jgi:prepilin-type N-terminal cleavage/methylation domain-containing protein